MNFFKQYVDKRKFSGKRLLSKTKGSLWWKKEWYSLCSAHKYYDVSCSTCTAGSWVNVWKHNVGSFMHKHFYKLWFWWVNK